MGAGWKDEWGLATQLVDSLCSFPMIRPLLRGKVFFLFFFLLWDHCVWRSTKWQTQTPGALQRLKASQDCCCCCSCHHPSLPLAWRNERMHASTSPSLLPLPSSSAPKLFSPLPHFISVKLCELFLNHLSCLYCRVFKKKQHSAIDNPFRLCGRLGRRKRERKSFKQIAKYWTCVKSCMFMKYV